MIWRVIRRPSAQKEQKAGNRPTVATSKPANGTVHRLSAVEDNGHRVKALNQVRHLSSLPFRESGREDMRSPGQVKAFQHVRATGEVTPSGWQPGRPTLTPGPALAGKVWENWKPEMAF